MPSLKRIRTRIVSVRSTQKITRAMKHVAAAKLRRAQDAILAARPYARRLRTVVAEIAGEDGEGEREHEFLHPLLRVRPERRARLLLMTSDRGLCGGFNANVDRAAERWIEDALPRLAEIDLAIVGKKGREYFRRKQATLVGRTYGAPSGGPEVAARARELATDLVADYTADRIDAVYVIYNELKSAISQRVAIEKLLPITPDPRLAGDGRALDFVFEPSRRALLDQILPMFVEIEIRRILLESSASELGARMSAMDNATTNASEMIASLTLQFNRARQAAITKELMEIIGGAEALKG